VVPKHFPATKLAARDSPLEWVAIHTSPHPTAYFLAGANSVFKSFPFELLVAGRTRNDCVSFWRAFTASRVPLDIRFCFDVYSGSISVLRMRRGRLASFCKRTSRRDDDAFEHQVHLAGVRGFEAVLNTCAISSSLPSLKEEHKWGKCSIFKPGGSLKRRSINRRIEERSTAAPRETSHGRNRAACRAT
jgi:hypothetical protein